MSLNWMHNLEIWSVWDSYQWLRNQIWLNRVDRGNKRVKVIAKIHRDSRFAFNSVQFTELRKIRPPMTPGWPAHPWQVNIGCFNDSNPLLRSVVGLPSWLLVHLHLLQGPPLVDDAKGIFTDTCLPVAWITRPTTEPSITGTHCRPVY